MKQGQKLTGGKKRAVLTYKSGTCNKNWCMSTKTTAMWRAQTGTKTSGILQKLPLIYFRQGAKPSVSATADWHWLLLGNFLHSHAYLQCNSVSASSQLITNTNTQMLLSLLSRALSTHQTHKWRRITDLWHRSWCLWTSSVAISPVYVVAVPFSDFIKSYWETLEQNEIRDYSCA